MSNLFFIFYRMLCYFIDRSCRQNGTGKISLERPRHRWEDRIIMDLKEIGIDTRNWVDSARDMDYWRALVNVELYLRVP